MSIMMNTKKIAENDNETTSMLDEYTKSTTFKDAFSKNLNEEVTLLKSENRALKKILEKLNKSMEEKDATLSEILTKNLNEETTKLKEKLEKITKMMEQEITSLRDESSEKFAKLNQGLRDANVMIGGWKVCA